MPRTVLTDTQISPPVILSSNGKLKFCIMKQNYTFCALRSKVDQTSAAAIIVDTTTAWGCAAGLPLTCGIPDQPSTLSGRQYFLPPVFFPAMNSVNLISWCDKASVVAEMNFDYYIYVIYFNYIIHCDFICIHDFLYVFFLNPKRFPVTKRLNKKASK